jgi:hypothetical protein
MSGFSGDIGNAGSGINPNGQSVAFWAYYPANFNVDGNQNDFNNIDVLTCNTINATNQDISGNIDVSGNITTLGYLDVQGNFGASKNALIPSTRTLATTPSTFTVQDVNGNWAIRVGSSPSTSDVLLNVSAGKTVVGQPAFNTELKVYGMTTTDSLDSNLIDVSSINVSNLATIPTIDSVDINNSGNMNNLGYIQSDTLIATTFQDISAVQGDIWYANNVGNFTRIPIGTNGQYLGSNGSLPIWSNPPAPTLSAVLTAGSDATNQSISNLNTLGSSTINNSGTITSASLVGTTRMETNLLENYSGTTIVLDAPTVNITPDVSFNVTLASVSGASQITALQGGVNLNVNNLRFGDNTFGFCTWGLGTNNLRLQLVNTSVYPFNFYFDTANQAVNSEFQTPILTITNVGAGVTDSGTSTQMGYYKIAGGYGFSRNWMIIPVFQSNGTSIARMRIALDKAYFATEQHPIRVPTFYNTKPYGDYYGLILSSKSQYINKPTKTEAHVYASISEKEKDKNAYGIYAPYDFVMENKEEDEQVYSLFIPQKIPETKIGYSSSGGEGQIWVCNINGNFEAGDYLCSSKICGVAMKQADSIKHNYTIFKSAFDCDFTTQISEYPVNVVDASGERQWRNPDDHSEGFVYQMETFENPVYELEVHYDYYEIKGVLKYYYDFKTKQPLLVGQKFKAMLIGGIYQN